MECKDETLVLNGPLTIKTIAEAKGRIEASIAGRGESGGVLKVLVESEETDLTLPQLLLSARESAAAAGMQLVLAKPAEGSLLAVIERAGLLSGDRAADSFWTEGEAA